MNRRALLLAGLGLALGQSEAASSRKDGITTLPNFASRPLAAMAPELSFNWPR